MIDKLTRSWQLFQASIAVTRRNHKLLWFPILNTFLTSLIALFFLAPLILPVILHHTGYHLNQKEHWVALGEYYAPQYTVKPHAPTPLTATSMLPGSGLSKIYGTAAASPVVSFYLLVAYFVSMFLATFFNVAFYNEIIEALNGHGVSFRRGLRVARSRLPSILAWSLLAGAVGWLIRMIEERLPLIGRLLTGLVGIAWSVAAVFAIPVIIQQPMRNPLKILEQSALTLKRTWGEGLIGYLGFSAGNGAIFLISLAPLLAVCGIAVLLKSIWLGVIGGVFWLIGLLFLAYIVGVAGQVYRCALYVYAAEGVVPEPYSPDLMDAAWKIKKN